MQVAPYLGTELGSSLYRLLGARMGWRAIVSLPLCHEPDLLDLGRDTETGGSILAEWGVTLGPYSALTNHVVLAPGCVVEAGAIVGDYSFLPPGEPPACCPS